MFKLLRGRLGGWASSDKFFTKTKRCTRKFHILIPMSCWGPLYKNFHFLSLFLNENVILISTIMNKTVTASILVFQKSRNSDFLQNHVRVHHAVNFLILVSFQFRYFQIRFFEFFCKSRFITGTKEGWRKLDS